MYDDLSRVDQRERESRPPGGTVLEQKPQPLSLIHISEPTRLL